MKTGTENKKKTMLAAVLGVIAIILVAWQVIPFFFGGNSAPSAIAPPIETNAANPAATSQPQANRANRNRTRATAKNAPVVNTLDPTIRLDLLASAEQQHYQGSGRNIFEAYVPPPPRRPESETSKNTPPPQPVNPGPPPPPPINLKFYGWASQQGQAKRIFLSQGDQIFIASEGDLVANRYKVVQIGNGFVKIEDILNNNVQQIPMT